MYDHYLFQNNGVLFSNVTYKSQDYRCDKISGLVKKQVKVCKKHSKIMSSVAMGAVQALHECGIQFQKSRWNCRTNSPHNILNNVLRNSYRESAFLYAISSAGVAHAVTRSCSRGVLKSCGCDRSVYSHPDGHSWIGCSDNIHFGKAYSKIFVDASEGRLDKFKRRKHVKKSIQIVKWQQRLARKVINLHNYEVGRQVLEELMRIQCKCHGVSGSCEMRSCWRTLPKFHEVGNKLKKKFDTAVRVNYAKARLRTTDEDARVASSTDLVYINQSPSYCTTAVRHGSYGTKGRLCSAEAGRADSCSDLCCGRGYQTEMEEMKERCNCKFQWCCKVVCKTCVSSQIKTRCK